MVQGIKNTSASGHSREAKLKLLEERLSGGQCTLARGRLGLHAPAQELETAGKAAATDASPTERTPPQDSDEEPEGHHFGIIDSRPAKRPRTEEQPSHSLSPQTRACPVANRPSRSVSPQPWGLKTARQSVTPLQERNGIRTPETARSHQQRRNGHTNTIEHYFPSLANDLPAGHLDAQVEHFAAKEKAWYSERESMQLELAAAREQARTAEAERKSKERQLKQERDSNSVQQKRITSAMQAAAAREKQTKQGLLELVTSASLAERDLLAYKLKVEGIRLGRMTLGQAGSLGMVEVWQDGQAFQDLLQRQQSLLQQKEAIDMVRQEIKKALPLPEPLAPGSKSNRSPVASQGGRHISPEDYVARDEIYKARLLSLQRGEDALSKETELLEVEKQRHLREVRRMTEEESCHFQCGTVLSERYVLQRLLGKGGFSEVYQAYDLEDLKEVAVKIHQLHSSWSDPKKSSYVKHATREFSIHRDLRHPRIVALLDIFELDANSFATVLELCAGGDLDTHLKEHKVLPEKEARVIIAQIFQGLAYLNEDDRRIIHFDLKPGNILFDNLGQVKITDFGLSKISEQGQTQGMELTSQGAGTYWYLPPECFEISTHPPIISNKVDVWSAAVILFQMVYGKRPFGEGLTQQRILRDDIMLNARQVEFPAEPHVSQKCKEFIARCLTYRQQDRPDVQTAVKDPYVLLKRAASNYP